MKKWCLESESCLASCHLFCACQVWPCSSNVFSIEHTVIHLTENVTNKVTNAWWQGFVKRFCEDCFYAVLNELLCSNNLIDHSFPNPEHELYQIHFRGIWCTKYENMAWCTQQLLQTIFVVDWGIAKVKDRLFCMLFLVAPLKSFFDECFKHTCWTIPLTTCAHRFLSDVIIEVTVNRVFWNEQVQYAFCPLGYWPWCHFIMVQEAHSFFVHNEKEQQLLFSDALDIDSEYTEMLLMSGGN